MPAPSATVPATPASNRPPRPVALVTGAARRIGREIALELARGGHDIAVHYRQSQREADETVAAVRALGVRAQAFPADLADEPACIALAGHVIEAFGRLDAVVHNASTFVYDDVHGFSVAAMERHARANTAPAVLLARALHAHLHARGAQGALVALLDQKLANMNPDYFSYTLSKAALQAATVMLAQALAPTLRVVGISPGVTLPSGGMDQAEFEAAHRLTPLGRSSLPADIARAVRFVIESPAITGTTLVVDGGEHLGMRPRDVMFVARQESP